MLQKGIERSIYMFTCKELIGLSNNISYSECYWTIYDSFQHWGISSELLHWMIDWLLLQVKKKRPGRDGKMAGLVPVLYVSQSWVRCSIPTKENSIPWSDLAMLLSSYAFSWNCFIWAFFCYNVLYLEGKIQFPGLIVLLLFCLLYLYDPKVTAAKRSVWLSRRSNRGELVIASSVSQFY